MTRFYVTGGARLSGTVTISGSKNAALPAMAAALLTDETVRLTNVPKIGDVDTLAEILRSLGADVAQIDDNTWEITAADITTAVTNDLASRLRASILLLGPLLARHHSIRLPHPGGCVIGKRPVGTHFEALRGLGAEIVAEDGVYIGTTNGLTGAALYLDEVSVTATENAVMAAALASGTTTIRPAALEPHVVNLCEMLVAMGANIEGIGTHTITVHGVEKLRGVTHRVVSDEIETGTYAVAAAITGGELTLLNAPLDLDPILYKLRAMGVEAEQDGDRVTVRRGEELVGTKLQVDTWPRFPTDLQPQFGALMTQAKGKSSIHEWMYESRLKYTESLAAMGADVTVINPHQVVIHGPTPLTASVIDSPDLRSGIAFVLAALVADGESTINHAQLILRGYGGLVEKLTALGATIRQEEAVEAIV